MANNWYVQMVEDFKTQAEAEAALAFLRTQVDFQGGRVIPPAGRGWWETSDTPAVPVWKVQAFFPDWGADCPVEMDGCRRVIVPDGQRKSLGFPELAAA